MQLSVLLEVRAASSRAPAHRLAACSMALCKKYESEQQDRHLYQSLHGIEGPSWVSRRAQNRGAVTLQHRAHLCVCKNFRACTAIRAPDVALQAAYLFPPCSQAVLSVNPLSLPQPLEGGQQHVGTSSRQVLQPAIPVHTSTNTTSTNTPAQTHQHKHVASSVHCSVCTYTCPLTRATLLCAAPTQPLAQGAITWKDDIYGGALVDPDSGPSDPQVTN